jgi:hypothetical protein
MQGHGLSSAMTGVCGAIGGRLPLRTAFRVTARLESVTVAKSDPETVLRQRLDQHWVPDN